MGRGGTQTYFQSEYATSQELRHRNMEKDNNPLISPILHVPFSPTVVPLQILAVGRACTYRLSEGGEFCK